MIVMRVRHQNAIDRRQNAKGDAWIVDALRSGEAERRRALRPYRIEQEIEPAGLNEPTGMADIGNAASRAFDPRRRPVGIRRRRPGRPLRLGSAPVTIDHPTPQVPAASRRRTIGIEKTLAVEMIGNRALVIARHPGGLYCAPAPAAGHNATVDVAGLCTYFPAALARDLTL